MENQSSTATTPVISADALLKHWQGHRGLSRRTIEAFPEEELFKFSIGGMRTYDQLLGEMIGLASAGINGFVTGKWETTPLLDHFNQTEHFTSKQQILEAWDEVTEQIDTLWPQIPAEHFEDRVLAFGQFENTVTDTILYFIDNEIHHRGQGYVYLRALGVEPPPFWDR